MQSWLPFLLWFVLVRNRILRSVMNGDPSQLKDNKNKYESILHLKYRAKCEVALANFANFAKEKNILEISFLREFLRSTNSSVRQVPSYLQGVTRRCRLSLLTNSALVYRVQMQGGGGDCEVSANECGCAHHVTWSPSKPWRSTSIFKGTQA